MLETRQDASFGVEALVLADRADVQELDSGALFEGAVAAASFENRAHAAAADVSERGCQGPSRSAFGAASSAASSGRLGGLPQEAAHGRGSAQQAIELRAQVWLVTIIVAQRMLRAAWATYRAGDPTQSRAGLIAPRLNLALLRSHRRAGTTVWRADD